MDIAERILSDIRFDTAYFIVDILIPCVLALVLGGVIGFQREKSERPAGLRTHILVCIGATVFTLVSYLGFASQDGFDSTRIAAGVVTGIGFIGAGVIFRQGPLVKGVTTAASIWVVAAIGLALGAKLYYLALIVTVLGFLTLSIIKYFEDKLMRLPNYLLRIVVNKDFESVDTIITSIKKISADIKSRKYEFDTATSQKIYSFNVHSRDPKFSNKALGIISEIKNIEKVTIN